MNESMTPERIAEIKDLLKYESSVAFYSSRAKESMLLLVVEAEEAARLRTELAAVRAELAEAERASHCQSVAAINGTRCALPVRHHGDHANEQRNHYWDDEFAAETEVAS